MLRGGYPEAIARTTVGRCNTWAKQYLDAIITRDVRDVAGVDTLSELPRFLQALARNRLNRVVKTPKLQFMDSGLLRALLGLRIEEVQLNRTRYGPVLKTFVFSELVKHATTSVGDYQIMYYRNVDKFEVDVVIENTAGQMVAVEIKASATVRESDFRGLKKLAHHVGAQFKMGVVLYDGQEVVPMGNKLWAAPISSIWGR